MPLYGAADGSRLHLACQVMLLCHLDDRDYEAAGTSLQSAYEVLQDTPQLLNGLKGDIAQA